MKDIKREIKGEEQSEGEEQSMNFSALKEKMFSAAITTAKEQYNSGDDSMKKWVNDNESVQIKDSWVGGNFYPVESDDVKSDKSITILLDDEVVDKHSAKVDHKKRESEESTNNKKKVLKEFSDGKINTEKNAEGLQDNNKNSGNKDISKEVKESGKEQQ